MEVWVNPACSKCRAATSALDEAGVDYTVRRYLDEPPTAGELRDVVGRLEIQAGDILLLLFGLDALGKYGKGMELMPKLHARANQSVPITAILMRSPRAGRRPLRRRTARMIPNIADATNVRPKASDPGENSCPT